MPTKRYNFTFASGATGSNLQFVGPHHRVAFVVSNMTSWNAGTGNASITIRGGLSETDNHVDILPSLGITTMASKGAYVQTQTALPYMSLGFGTAVTGTQANNIDVILYTDDL